MISFLDTLWSLVTDAAPWLMIGLVTAGLVRALVPDEAIARVLGRPGARSIVLGAVLGVPLPLCSCSVLPVALGIRRQGASRGATASFLVSTPENGADSIALSYALLGPFMAILRPVASVLSAVTTGLFVDAMPAPAPDREAPDAGACDRCCHASAHRATRQPLPRRIAGGIRYALTSLYIDMAGWLCAGLVLAALMQTLIPPDALARWGSGVLPMIAMVFVGIPIYICATASTPVAASMLLAGVSPGTVLVFLLAGPATNMATVMVVRRELGARTAWIYIATIGVTSVLLGLATDAIVAHWTIDINAQVSHAGHLIPHWAGVASAVVLLAIVPVHLIGKTRRRPSGAGDGAHACGCP